MMRRMVVIVIGFLVICGNCSFAADQCVMTDQNLIKVNGSASVQAEPDRARIRMQVSEITTSIIEAKKNVDKKVLKIQNMMVEAGLDKADISAANFRVYQTPEPHPPLQKAGEQPQEIKYTVSRDVIAIVKELDQLDRILDAAISLGTNEVRGVDFFSSKEEELTHEALINAAENARVKAKVLAGKFGCELGKVVLIQESGGVRPMPMLMERSMVATGFAQGEVEITAQVYAEFEIK